MGRLGRRTEDTATPFQREGLNADRTFEHAPDTRCVLRLEFSYGLSERVIAASLELGKVKCWNLFAACPGRRPELVAAGGAG
jgi:hypothetical protein